MGVSDQRYRRVRSKNTNRICALSPFERWRRRSGREIPILSDQQKITESEAKLCRYLPPPRKANVCRHFLNGFCERGDACNFLHVHPRFLELDRPRCKRVTRTSTGRGSTESQDSPRPEIQPGHPDSAGSSKSGQDSTGSPKSGQDSGHPRISRIAGPVPSLGRTLSYISYYV